MKYLFIICVFASILFGISEKEQISTQITEYCKIRASAFKSESITNHVFNTCYKETLNKNLSLNLIKEMIKNENSAEDKKRNVEQKIQNSKARATKLPIEIVGVWFDNKYDAGSKIILYYVNDKLFLDRVHTTYTITTEMTKKHVDGRIEVFDIVGKHFDEYFVITPFKDFQFWSGNRHYYTATKLKYNEEEIQQQIIGSQKSLAQKITNDLKETQYKRTIKLIVSVIHHVTDNKVYFSGTTNLPPNTKVGISIDNKASDFKIYIKDDGTYMSTGFGSFEYPLVGKHEVSFMVYRNLHWQTDETLEKLKNYYGYGIDEQEGRGRISNEFHFDSKIFR